MPPTMLIESLHNVRRRVKVLGVLYGAGIVAAAAVGLLVAVVFLDWLLGLPRAFRMVVNVAALGALGWALWHFVVRPVLRKLTLSDLAGRLEDRFPQFDDSLRSTVNFMAGEVPGSEVMKERTVAKATATASRVDFSRAVDTRPVWYSILGGLGAAVLLALLLAVVDPAFRHIAANRLLGGAAAWPKSVEIQMLSSVPQRVAVGQPVDVKMRLKKGTAKQAVLHYRFDNGRWEHEVIKPGPDGVFATSVAARLDGNKDAGRLEIKVEAEDDEQALSPVVVVPRLDIRGVVAQVTPPAYAHLPANPVAIGDRPVVTVMGSTIDLQVSFNKALDTAKGVAIEPSDKNRKAPEVQWSYPAAGQAVGRFVTGDGSPNAANTFKPNDPFRFTIHATDTDGFQNTGTQEYQVIVHDDSMPTVQIEEPRRAEERTPNATVPLKVVAEDDYGIEAAQLVVTGVSANVQGKTWNLPLVANNVAGQGVSFQPADSSTERKRFRLEYGWDLEKLEGANLKPGDVLEFFVQVKDNFNFNGNQHAFVPSGKLRITIISHDQWDVVVEQILAATRQEIGQIIKTENLARSETEAQAQETAQKGKYDEAQRATAGRLANQQSTATAQAKQASDRLKELVQKMAENKSPEKGAKETAQQVSQQLNQTAESPMKQAGQDLNQAKDTKSDPKAGAQQQKADAQKAAAAMEKAAQNQAEASKQLELAMNKLEKFGGIETAIKNIEDIKKEQAKIADQFKNDPDIKQALGKPEKDLTPEEKKKLEKLAEEQKDLAKRTDEAFDKMAEKGEKLTKMDPAAAQAMKDAAKEGKTSQQIPQKQSNPQTNKGAAQNMQQNQQANAQQQHKEIDLGLEMILNKLKEAERRKLEELGKELAELQKLIGELAARQAGHNIDNLLLQDETGKKVTALSQQEREDLFKLADRDFAKLAELKADLTVLTPSQEQTERNARDLSKRAEPLADPTPAAKLSAAAGKMEQAIVYLRKAQADKAQLAEAYSPPQVEALKALLDARKAVDEMKKKNDAEKQEKDEEAIRQAYVKLLEAQKKLDEETIRVNKAPRDEQGNLNRADSNSLARLPGEQGKNAEDAEKLGKRLESLGSIVYTWANKDIVTSMKEVKDDLGKPETGVLVQSEQRRIERQLDAMIKNLAKKQQDQSKFADKGGGGGGSGGKKPPPKMPTDIELRLLKGLQEAVNDDTKTVNDQKAKDAHKLLALGGRQGELRALLDQLLQQATKGQVKLGKEPDKADQLPEEASKDDIDTAELTKQLLDDDTSGDTTEKTVKLVGDRMGRSRQRLALDNDPGQVTQEIQKRIVMDLDGLIALAQKQQAANSKPGQGDPKDGQQPGQPKPGQAQGQQQANGQQKPGQHQEGGSTPAGDSSLSPGSDPQADLSKELREKGDQWGTITPRGRDAVLEGRNENLADKKYDQFVKDYYREVAKKASER